PRRGHISRRARTFASPRSTRRAKRSRSRRRWALPCFLSSVRSSAPGRISVPAAPCDDSRAGAPRGDLDLDLHLRLDQAADEGRGSGPCLAEELTEDGCDALEVAVMGEVVVDANHVVQARTGLLQRAGDVAERLPRLALEVWQNGHRRVVVPGGAGYENPVAVRDRPAEAG